MVRSELVAKVAAENPHLTRAEAERIVRLIFDAIVGQLEGGGRVELRGFGSFTVRTHDEHPGRNPRTGEPIHVKGKNLPYFRIGKELRDRLNAE
jgi:integration host factor subunit beta